MSTLHALEDALDERYPEEPVEELKRLVTDLSREIHEDRGATRVKLDEILVEQRIISERVTRLEERERACADGNATGHKAIWKTIEELRVDGKEREAEVAKGRRSMYASIVAAVGAAVAAGLHLFKP